MKKIKEYLIIILFLIILILALIFIFISKNNENNNISKCEIVLMGEDYMTLYENDPYNEPGYYYYCNGKVERDGIKVSKIDTSIIGEQKIIYSKDGYVKTRTINIIKDDRFDEKKIIFKLKNDELVIINQNDNYIDDGVIALYDNENIISYVTTENNVDTSIPGNYIIKYVLSYKGYEKVLEKKIRVLAINDLELTTKVENKSNNNFVISIEASGTNFAYLVLPNGDRIASKNYNYSVSKNGVYTIYAYDKFGNFQKKDVEIKNIDTIPPVGTCKVSNTLTKSTINVSASDNGGIAKYSYYASNILLSENKYSKYEFNRRLEKEVYVLVYDTAGNKSKIVCNIELDKKLNGYVQLSHMGYRVNGAKDNSKESYLAAAKAGYYGIEGDLQLRGNGLAMVHDRGKSYCSFEEYLKIIKEYNLVGIVDLKSSSYFKQYGSWKKMVQDAVNMVKSYGMLDQIVWQGGIVEYIVEIKRIEPNAVTWLLWNNSSTGLTRIINDAKKSQAIGVNINKKIISQKIVNTLHNNGLKVSTYSCDSKSDKEKYNNMNVDYIMSNKP